MQYFDILLFAVIAGVLLLRLRGMLGRRTGTEAPPPGPAETASPVAEREGLAEVAEESPADEDEPVRAGLAAISQADRSFDPDQFLGGALKAFEIIVTAFAAGDRKAIAPLLAPSVLESFERAIDGRERAGHVRETRIVSMAPMEIEEARLEGTRACVTVRFDTERVDVTRDADGDVVEGDSAIPERATDLWTFERDMAGTDPNWVLVRTGN